MNIAQRRIEIEQRIKEAEGQVMIIKAELKALQHLCSHEGAEKWTHHDYGGGSSAEFKCHQCGLRTSR